MQVKKGDVVRADLKLGDHVVSRYFVVTDGNKLFQVAEGYNVTSVGIGIVARLSRQIFNGTIMNHK